MTKRREFLGWLGASSVLATIPQQLHAESLPVTPESGLPISAAFDMKWFDRLPGKRVAVFDSPSVSDGLGIFRAVLWRKQYMETYGTEPTAIVPVLVLRHEGIALVMDDEYWERYEIGKKVKMRDPATNKWAKKNPVGSKVPGTPAAYAEYNIESLINAGGVVLACNLAFGDCVANIQKEEKLSREDAREKALSLMIPGIVLQPSGFFAALKAQETGGGYILAS